jgi:hypothetical protein
MGVRIAKEHSFRLILADTMLHHGLDDDIRRPRRNIDIHVCVSSIGT